MNDTNRERDERNLFQKILVYSSYCAGEKRIIFDRVDFIPVPLSSTHVASVLWCLIKEQNAAAGKRIR